MRFSQRASIRGFALVEVLVALVVFTVGVLALAGSAARITRMVGAGRRDLAAAAAASARIETLYGLACDAVVSGEESRDRMTLRWTISALHTGSRHVLLYVERPGRVEYVVTTAIPCAS